MYQPTPPQQYNPYSMPLPTSTLAIVSLISGIIGFTFLPFLAGIIALITGYMARGETRSVPPRASGDGLATAGIVMGYIQIVLGVVVFCCIIAYFVLVGGIIWTANR